MAITTLDGVIAGLRPADQFIKVSAATTAGRHRSLFYSAGLPGAATAPSPGVNGAALTTYGGQLPFTNPGAGNTYLARLAATCNAQVGTVLLCDRLWHNSGLSVTLTTPQAIVSGAMPARDRDGAVTGADLIVGLEVTTVMGAGTPTITVDYTNTLGVASRSASATAPTTMAAGDVLPFTLQAGDLGIQSIQGLTLSATMTSGAFSLVVYRLLASVPCGQVGVEGALDALSSGMPRLYDNTVPFLVFLPSTTTAPTISGQLIVTQG
jgi:hypothetical protein